MRHGVARRAYYRSSRGEVKAVGLAAVALVAAMGVFYLSMVAAAAAVITLVVKAII